jgi:hypothetical protein
MCVDPHYTNLDAEQLISTIQLDAYYFPLSSVTSHLGKKKTSRVVQCILGLYTGHTYKQKPRIHLRK